MRYFGAPGDAPVYEDTEQGPTPVGRPCLSCTYPVKRSDRGFLIPYAGGATPGKEEPWHRECFLSDIIGDLAHDLLDSGPRRSVGRCA